MYIRSGEQRGIPGEPLGLNQDETDLLDFQDINKSLALAGFLF